MLSGNDPCPSRWDTTGASQDEDPEHESAATKSLKEQISQLDAERKELVKEGVWTPQIRVESDA